MNGSCHCGAVTIQLESAPAFLNACNCSLCLKLGVLWGYYPASTVTIAGETRGYVREDVPQPGSRFHFCGRCGATTHWSLPPSDTSDRAGINMRLFDPAALKGVEVRYCDRRNHDSDEHVYRRSTVFDGAGAEA